HLLVVARRRQAEDTALELVRLADVLEPPRRPQLPGHAKHGIVLAVRKAVPIACALAVAAVLVPAASAKPAPVYANPTAAAKPLVLRFFTLIQRKDVAGLAAFLSPAFQVQRADGTSSGKADYLKNLPDVKTFVISNLFATQAGGTLVVRYQAKV